MQYQEKMNPEDLQNTIIEKVHNGYSSEIFIKNFDNFMDKYKSNPKMFVEDLASCITKTIDDGGELEDFTDEEFLKSHEYVDYLKHIQKDFSNYGFNISAMEAEIIWSVHSDNLFAEWLSIHDYYDTFLEVMSSCFLGCK